MALSLNNTDDAHEKGAITSSLGIPLPAGIVRVYKQDASSIGSGQQQTIFIGEDNIDHVPRNENITLQIGNAFDIVGETTLVSESNPSKEVSISSYNVTLRNRGNESSPTILVNVNDLNEDWQILNSSIPFVKKDASSIQFSVTIPANSQRSFDYRIQTIQTITPPSIGR